MHCDNAIAAAVSQRLLVCLGEFGRGGACGRDAWPVVDVVRHVVHPVAKICIVEKDVQRHLPDVELLELV